MKTQLYENRLIEKAHGIFDKFVPGYHDQISKQVQYDQVLEEPLTYQAKTVPFVCYLRCHISVD
jgi:hypothetical protein